MKVINGHVIHTKGAALATWRSSIALAARKAGAFPNRNPVTITMDFIFTRPKTVKRLMPTVPPDLDKLVRAVLDALTAIAYIDDSQVVEIYAKKTYGLSPGVKVQVDYK
jgi:crossover junction endodeoxyribonuclease RusA